MLERRTVPIWKVLGLSNQKKKGGGGGGGPKKKGGWGKGGGGGGGGGAFLRKSSGAGVEGQAKSGKRWLSRIPDEGKSRPQGAG